MLPPPVIMMPLVDTSATSSGGVRSSTAWMLSRIRSVGSSRCLLTGLPKTITVSSAEMMEAFEEPTERILESIHAVLERILHHGLVELVAGYFNRGGLHHAAQGNDGDVGGAAADVHHHVPVGLHDVDARADGGGDGLLNEVHPPAAGLDARVHHEFAQNRMDN